MNNPKKSIKMSVTATTTEDYIFNPANQLRALIEKDASRDMDEFIRMYYDHANRDNDTNSDRYGCERTTHFQRWINRCAPKYSIITGASMEAIETWMVGYLKDMADQLRRTRDYTYTREKWEWKLTNKQYGAFLTRFKDDLHSSLNASLNKAAAQRIEQRENQSK